MPKLESDQSLLTSKIRWLTPPNPNPLKYWIGLRRQHGTNTWTWYDGEVLTKPTDWGGEDSPSSDCVNLLDQGWYKYGCKLGAPDTKALCQARPGMIVHHLI